MISDLEIKLNDVSLSDYFDLTEEPDRGLFPEVQHELVQMAHVNGSRTVNKRITHRIITLPLYALSGNFRQTKDDLANVLFAEERLRLWFSDEPDRYWLVELTGESSWKRSLENRGEAYGELKFICEDGLSHAMTTKSFPFITTSEGTIATLQNNGTYKTPIDINITFTSDANSIGFVSPDNVIQLGTSFSEDDDNPITSEKILNDGMGSSSGWSINVGRPRWRFPDSGDNTSKIMGALKFDVSQSSVYPSSFGNIDASKPGYWHGPTLTRLLTKDLNNFDVLHRLQFKPTGSGTQRASCQGLMEINYMDADGNFVMGFEIKDNNMKADEVKYSFFVGDYRLFEGKLPSTVLTKNGGFFGSLKMTKENNKFTFHLARLLDVNGVWKESWSVTKSWSNATVAMLSANSIQAFFSQWKNDRAMDMALTHTTVTKLSDLSDRPIPKVFYEGDNLLVDGTSNRVYINGMRDDSYRVIGSSQVFNSEKGSTEVIAISDGTFTGNLEIRERYL
ncbi:distal tail protein Dit [Enterococcus gallinarum]|uniref:distal tail protein Dit n=1 Tax=Enterococcus gallinarum TaxID=1353 RepID=UPI001C60CD73|nr:distal tail protein Dit [Enterococcus gallinarum]MBW5474373.1 hypothetical protein [Enterococcus gallinarum]UJA23334.1 hypothetical protein HED61_07035 [Enterococcus gallinarum]